MIHRTIKITLRKIHTHETIQHKTTPEKQKEEWIEVKRRKEKTTLEETREAIRKTRSKEEQPNNREEMR